MRILSQLAGSQEGHPAYETTRMKISSLQDLWETRPNLEQSLKK